MAIAQTVKATHFALQLQQFKGYKMTYYDKQITALLKDAPAAIKIQNEGGHTNWLNVTPEQIKAILAILNKGA